MSKEPKTQPAGSQCVQITGRVWLSADKDIVEHIDVLEDDINEALEQHSQFVISADVALILGSDQKL